MPTAGETMRFMADAAISGAGQLGIIFAQFLVGLSESIGEAVTVSIDAFALAAKHAERRAREAVLIPIEGTILTLIKDWVRSFEEHKHLRDFGLIFHRSLKGARQSLDNTPNLLPVLREERVVDAGGVGLLPFPERGDRVSRQRLERVSSRCGGWARRPASIGSWRRISSL